MAFGGYPFHYEAEHVSAWRRVALERFPERTREIEAARSIYDLLGQLEQDLRATYRGDEPELADRVFEFAAWCFAPDQSWELRNAVAVGFYEHLPNVGAGRRDMAARLGFAALIELHPLFHQMLPPQEYEALQMEVARVHGRELPRVSEAAT